MTIRTDILQKDHDPLDTLTNVRILNPTNGQALTYNSTTGLWENTAGGEVPVAFRGTRFRTVFFALATPVAIL
jgi:hypothetical protein